MRRKVSTLLEESLFRRAKLESVRQGKQISQILGDALEDYLDQKNPSSGGLNIVDETWGALKIDKKRLLRLMTEEADFLDD